VFFYQPLVWWLRGRLRLEQDYLADGAAAADSPAVEDYAEFLTNLAARTFRSAVGLAMVGKKSDLYRRVVMLVSRQDKLEPRCPRGWSLIVGLTTVTLVAALSVVGGAVADPEVRVRRDKQPGAAPPAPATAQTARGGWSTHCSGGAVRSRAGSSYSTGTRWMKRESGPTTLTAGSTASGSRARIGPYNVKTAAEHGPTTQVDCSLFQAIQCEGRHA
jgi:hypothetical protein